MACFIVSGVEAAVVTLVEKTMEKKEQKTEATEMGQAEPVRIPLSRKLKWLRNMLLGGVVLLAFEHVWHGEVVPWFPFLTAMSNPADAMEMFHEMATIGVGMAVLITAAWGCMCFAADSIMKRPAKEPSKM